MNRSSAQLLGCCVSLGLGLLFALGVVVFGLADKIVVYLVLTMLPAAGAAFVAGRSWKAVSLVAVVMFFMPALLLGLFTNAEIEGLWMPFVIATLCAVVIGAAAVGILMGPAERDRD